MSHPVVLISALARNHVIGTQEGMPWHVPAEYQQYLGFIRDQTVIMGRRTYEIFGADLTSRYALVVSRSLPPGKGYQICHSLSDALAAAQLLGRTIFVAGGASIYAQALPWADAMYLSYIEGTHEGTAYFPAFDPAAWEVTERQVHPQFEFVRYRRRAKRETGRKEAE